MTWIYNYNMKFVVEVLYYNTTPFIKIFGSMEIKFTCGGCLPLTVKVKVTNVIFVMM